MVCLRRCLVVTWLVPRETAAVSARSLCSIQLCTIYKVSVVIKTKLTLSAASLGTEAGTYASLSLHACARARTRVHTYARADTHARTHTHTHTHTRARARARAYKHMHAHERDKILISSLLQVLLMFAMLLIR